jgi:hypothetical protein
VSTEVRGPVRARPGASSPAPARPTPPAVRWTPGAIARRRSLTVARAERDAAEARGDPAYVVSAWDAVIWAIEGAEQGRVDPPPVDEDAMDELERQSLRGDELPRALADPDTWTSEGDDDDPDGEDEQ